MEHSKVLKHVVWTAAMLVAAVVLVGCQPPKPKKSDEQKTKPAAKTDTEPQSKPDLEPTGEPDKEPAGEPDKEPAGEPDKEPLGPPDEEPLGPPDEEPAAEPDIEPSAEKTPDLGPPLVDDPTGLTPLEKNRPVWIDKKNERIVMVGQVCQTDVPLELFACLKETKEHEAIVTVDVKAATVHAGLLVLGAEVGHPARFDPTYEPATGTEIEVTVTWKDEQGKRQTKRAQEWIRNAQTKEAMTQPWVFAGSGFWDDPDSGERYYQAEGGDFICVSNFTTAMLDLPIESSQVNEALMFQAFTERIPPRGTVVTLMLTPKLNKTEKAE